MVLPSVPLMLAAVDDPTAVVDTAKVAVVEPAVTETDVGSVALVELDARVITAPPVGAGPERVTVPMDEFPPTTDAGAKDKLVRVAAVTAKEPLAEVEPRVPVTVAETFAATAVVVAVNVTVEVPAATVTEAGTATLVELDLRLTTAPPTDAAPVNVTVPVEEVPPRTDAGLNEMLWTPAGVTVRVAVCELVPNVPFTVMEP